MKHNFDYLLDDEIIIDLESIKIVDNKTGIIEDLSRLCILYEDTNILNFDDIKMTNEIKEERKNDTKTKKKD